MEGRGEDISAEVGCDVEEGGGREFSQGKMDVDFGGVSRPLEDLGSIVGGVAANIQGV